jgi:hypothetical protein
VNAQRRDRIGARARMLLAFAVAANAACLPAGDASDPMFTGDLILKGRFAELLPDVPWMDAGRDGRFGTQDDEVVLVVVGDVDLVVRAGVTGIGATLPPTSPLRGGPPETITEPFGGGVPIDFAVTATSADGGTPVDSPALASAPVLAVAFADLDGDGFVGVTSLDGDGADADLEEAELTPVGRRFALAQGSRAAGQLFVSAGAPAGAALRVLVTAAAYTGATDPNHFGGVVPTGPAVLTAFPFLPRTDPDRVLDGNLPGAADADELVGVEVEDQFNPDPNARYGEAFTLPTDGSVASVDVALARSGAPVRFGVVQPADPRDVVAGVPLRPGLGASGQRVLFALPDALPLPGGSSEVAITIVPLDRLGNVADLAAPTPLTVRATGAARIVAPDGDGDATIETLVAGDASGVAVTLDGQGSAGGAAGLVIEGAAGLSFVELLDAVAAQ